MPADVEKKTRAPSGSTSERSTTPTPCTPGTYGVAGRPK
jgi:hypothetical protein